MRQAVYGWGRRLRRRSLTRGTRAGMFPTFSLRTQVPSRRAGSPERPSRSWHSRHVHAGASLSMVMAGQSDTTALTELRCDSQAIGGGGLRRLQISIRSASLTVSGSMSPERPLVFPTVSYCTAIEGHRTKFECQCCLQTRIKPCATVEGSRSVRRSWSEVSQTAIPAPLCPSASFLIEFTAIP